MPVQILTCKDQEELRNLAHIIGFTLQHAPHPVPATLRPEGQLGLKLEAPPEFIALINELHTELKDLMIRQRLEEILAYTAPMPAGLKKGESSRPKIVPLRLPREDRLGF